MQCGKLAIAQEMQAVTVMKILHGEKQMSQAVAVDHSWSWEMMYDITHLHVQWNIRYNQFKDLGDWYYIITHHYIGRFSLQWGECQYFSSSGSRGRACWNHCSRPKYDKVTLSQWSEHHQLHFDGCSGLSPYRTQPDRNCRPQTGVVPYCSISLGTRDLLSMYLWL